jgi:hypothetical protein
MKYNEKMSNNKNVNNNNNNNDKEDEQFIEIILNTIINICKRSKNIQDPATRHCLFVGKLCF